MNENATIYTSSETVVIRIRLVVQHACIDTVQGPDWV